MEAKISSLFKSIQGEGKYAGCAQVFVRFYGCNLACSYCDTRLTRFKEYTAREIRDKVHAFGINFVAFTGGEPLVQAEALAESAAFLKKDGCTLLLETNGTLYKQLKKVISFIDIISCDLKLKSSTGQRSQWSAHDKFFGIGRKKDLYFKAVICPGTDMNDIRKMAVFLKDKKKYPLYLQPEAGKMSKAFLSRIFSYQEYILKKGIDVRVIPQIHKILGIR